MKLSLVTKKCLAGLLLLSFIISGSVYSMETSKRVESKKEQKPLIHQIDYQCGNTTIKLGFGDIVEQKFCQEDGKKSAIVNATNMWLAAGNGVSEAIFEAAGREALTNICENDEKFPQKTSRFYGRNKVRIEPGEAVITQACGQLKNNVTHIIHALGPDCKQPNQQKEKETLLTKAYRNILTHAKTNDIRSIAFVTISGRIFQYPVLEAARVACPVIVKFVKENPNSFDEIRLVMYANVEEGSVNLQKDLRNDESVDDGIRAYQEYEKLLLELIKIENTEEIDAHMDAYIKEQNKSKDASVIQQPKSTTVNTNKEETKPTVNKPERERQQSFFSRYKKQFFIGSGLTAAVLVFGWLWWNKK
jgi:O-acetyl-ADP-ribose deacetylase (regulator of RNase III)